MAEGISCLFWSLYQICRGSIPDIKFLLLTKQEQIRNSQHTDTCISPGHNFLFFLRHVEFFFLPPSSILRFNTSFQSLGRPLLTSNTDFSSLPSSTSCFLQIPSCFSETRCIVQPSHTFLHSNKYFTQQYFTQMNTFYLISHTNVSIALAAFVKFHSPFSLLPCSSFFLLYTDTLPCNQVNQSLS